MAAIQQITLGLFLVVAFATSFAETAPVVHKSHGLSRFGTLKYPVDFKHFDYVNPDAPKGGELRLFVHGTFDSLNPYASRGISPVMAPSFNYMRYGFSEFNEPLLVGTGFYSPSGDEFKSAYGLIAESVEYPEDNRWIIFNLRPRAWFHDGVAITAKDVAFSFHALREKGHPRYKTSLEQVERVEILGSHRVEFIFREGSTRPDLFAVAELPILPEHYWQGRALDKSSLTPPLNSGPYQISDIRQGVSVTFSRVKDYWGKDLPVNKGRYNFDKIILYFHRDLQSAFESFKAGGHDIHLEVLAKNWHSAYNFPAVRQGLVKKRVIPHNMAYGSSLFFFNTRRWPFDDIRVRQAVSMMFDYEWLSKAIFYRSYKRVTSYFPNSPMGSSGLPSNAERKLLVSWGELLPEGTATQPFQPSTTQGNGQTRQHQRQALSLLKKAGWQLQSGKLRHTETGESLEFTFLGKDPSAECFLLPFKKQLKTIGIDMHYTRVDAAHYYRRLCSKDFDMVDQIIPQVHTPDRELESYFHSSQANVDCGRNFAGIQHPAVDKLIRQVLDSKTFEEMQVSMHSLDRVLLWQHYGVPKWYTDYMRVAYRDVFGWPEVGTKYTTPFSTWWRKDL